MKLEIRRSKRTAGGAVKCSASAPQKTRTLKKASRLVLRPFCGGNLGEMVSLRASSSEQAPAPVITSTVSALDAILDGSALPKSLSRRQSAMEAVRNLRRKLTFKRSSTREIGMGREAANDTEKVDSSLRHAQSILLSRLRFQSRRANRDKISTLFETTEVDSSRPQTRASSTLSLSNTVNASGAQKCSTIDVIISNVRLNLMWTDKQHFVYANRRRTTLSDAVKTSCKFALLCVAIADTSVDTDGASQEQPPASYSVASFSVVSHSRADDTVGYRFGVTSMSETLDEESIGQLTTNGAQIVCSEIVRDVDWSATDVVFKTPLRVTFHRESPQSIVILERSDAAERRSRGRSTSDLNDGAGSRLGRTRSMSRSRLDCNANSKTQSVRLEFYATPHDADDDGLDTEDDSIADNTVQSRRLTVHASADSAVRRRPYFRLIATAALPLADLERQFESGQVAKAKAAGRAQFLSTEFDYNTTVARPLERLPIAMESCASETGRQAAKRSRVATLKTAVRRLSGSVQSVAADNTSVMSSSDADQSGEPAFRIPLFGAFTFALRVNAFDLQTSFV